MSDDDHADRNSKLKAAMRQKETPLNKDGGKGEVPCSPCKRQTAVRCRQGILILVLVREVSGATRLMEKDIWLGMRNDIRLRH